MSFPILPAIGIEKLKKNEKEVIFSVEGCQTCEYEDKREYEEGDIVFKILEKKCPKCDSKMTIKQIFSEIVKK